MPIGFRLVVSRIESRASDFLKSLGCLVAIAYYFTSSCRKMWVNLKYSLFLFKIKISKVINVSQRYSNKYKET